VDDFLDPFGMGDDARSLASMAQWLSPLPFARLALALPGRRISLKNNEHPD